MTSASRWNYRRGRTETSGAALTASPRQHKFKLGQEVRYLRKTIDRVSRDVEESLFASSFEVTRLLPASGPEFQYRLKNLMTGQERIAAEGELILA